MGKVCSCNTVWTFHPQAQGPEASSITVTKWSKEEKKPKLLNYLLLTSQLPIGQTVISVSLNSAFCSLKISVLFWIITFSLNKNPVNWNTQLNNLVFTLQWSFPDVQSNALIKPKGFEILYLIIQLKVSDYSCTYGIYSIIRKKKFHDFIEVSSIIQRLLRGRKNTAKNISLLHKSCIVWKLYILLAPYIITKAEFVWME